MLDGKTAVIHGGGGAIGGAVARAFAGAGAHVYLAGRTRARLDAVADEIGAAGVAEVDVLDERAVAAHADAVAAEAGGIDVALTPRPSRTPRPRCSPIWPSTTSCARSTRTCAPT